MRVYKTHKCPVCNKMYRESLAVFENHLRKEHPGTIPEGWTIRHYVYFLHTGKTAGTCRVCKKPTSWNEATGCYARMCGSEACKKIFRDEFMKNLRNAGKENLMDDPKHREKMLVNRRISGVYTFRDGGEVSYMGRLEKEFLQMLDTFFAFPSADIIGPSPNRYIYHYDNPNDQDHKGEHTYIPDFYIPSANLEIEIKSSKNERPSNLTIDVIRDAFKDIRMIRDPLISYVKLYENDYHVFFQVFADIAQQNMEGGLRRPIKYISRSLLTSIYKQYIPSDCMKIIQDYIYKYSESSVLESQLMSALEADGEEIDVEESSPQEEGFDIVDAYLNDNQTSAAEDDEADEPIEVSMLIDPVDYYNLTEEDERAANEGLTVFDIESNDGILPAMEFFGLTASKSGIDTKTAAGKAAIANSRWRDKLFGSKSITGSAASKLFTNVKIVNQKINISGINCNLLLYRIKEKYEESRLKYIFEYKYNANSWKSYQKKKISRGEMKIDSVHAPVFFALELVTLFRDLGAAYKDASYSRIATLIYENTWLSTADSITVPDLSLKPLENIDTMTLLPYQQEFIRLWPRLKSQLNTKGYILSFKPGKGKTLTAIGLAECLKSKHIYIVCPNNLKDNWAMEIKKYYSKYKDETLWMKDVCILGTKDADPSQARFIITNNESIGLMQAIAVKDPDSMFILDESHNFSNFKGTRSAELFKLVDTIQSDNILCMSATPIKAVPAEITPVLRLIDPTFTDEAAQMFARCFELSNVAATKIIEQRFGKIIYRPENADVVLPERRDSTVQISIPMESRYYLKTVHDEIIESFKKIHEAWAKENKGTLKEFEDGIFQYSLAPRRDTLAYIGWVFSSSDSLDGANNGAYHELEVKEYKVFFDEYVRTNTKCPGSVINSLAKLERELLIACKSHMGTAIGGIIHARRAEMFIAMYEAYKETLYEQIRNRSKKTVIFSTMVPVINHIEKDLTNFGIKNVCITGATKDRLAKLIQFKEDPATLVLVATSHTLGTGLTLTEASQMFFFGTPWRSVNYDQAAARIHRISQTEEVDIYSAVMVSAEPNLSTRMQDILEWSDRMFNAAVTSTELSEEFTTAVESQLPWNTHKLKSIFELNDRLNQYSYGCLVDGRIVDNENDAEFEAMYRTLTSKEFEDAQGGVCYDFAAYQAWWLSKRGIIVQNYFLECLTNHNTTHTFSVIRMDDRYIYIESSYQKIRGVYQSDSIEKIISYIANNMLIDERSHRSSKVLCYRIFEPKKSLEHLTVNEYVAKVKKSGQPVQYLKDFNLLHLDPLQNTSVQSNALESMLTFKDRIDGPQYVQIEDDGDIEILNWILDAYHQSYGYSNYFSSDLNKHIYSPVEIRAERSKMIPEMSRTIHLHQYLREYGVAHEMYLFSCARLGESRLACLVPFHSGYLYIQPSEIGYPNIDMRCNYTAGLFFKNDSLVNIGSTIIMKTLSQTREDEFKTSKDYQSTEFRIYPVSHRKIVYAMSRSISNIGFIEDIILTDESHESHTLNVKMEPFHQVEVLNNGVIFERY